MNKSKLFSLLEQLRRNKGEIGSFDRFVQSPYFNSKEEVIRLIAIIRKFWHSKEHIREKHMTKELVFKKIFPKEKQYVPWKMNQCVSDLTQLLIRFLGFQEINEEDERHLKIRAYKTRGMDDQFFKECELLEMELKEEMNSKPFVSVETYEAQMANYERLSFHPKAEQYSELNQGDRLRVDSIILEDYYTLKMLIRYCEMATNKLLFQGQFNIPNADEIVISNQNDLSYTYLKILELFQKKDYKLVLPLKNKVRNLLKAPGTHNKLRLFELFFSAIPSFPEKLGRLNVYLEIYAFAIQQKILLEGNFLALSHTTNIIHIGHVLGKHQWVTNFIKTNKKYLANSRDKGENVQCLFEAYSNYYQKNYNETFLLLDQLKLEDCAYGIKQHHMLLTTLVDGRDKIHFKYDFHTKCQSFRAYLNRKLKEKQLSEVIRRNNLDFTRIIEKVYNAPFQQLNKESLLAELEANMDIPYKNWLSVKIGQA